MHTHTHLVETMWHLRSIQRLQHNSNSRFTFSSKTMSLLNRIHTLHSQLNYFIYQNVDALQEWNEKLIELETLVVTILYS